MNLSAEIEQSPTNLTVRSTLTLQNTKKKPVKLLIAILGPNLLGGTKKL